MSELFLAKSFKCFSFFCKKVWGRLGACAPRRNNSNADWADDADFRVAINSTRGKSVSNLLNPCPITLRGEITIIPTRRASAHPIDQKKSRIFREEKSGITFESDHDWSRTSTSVRTLPPQSSASTNSATWPCLFSKAAAKINGFWEKRVAGEKIVVEFVENVEG